MGLEVDNMFNDLSPVQIFILAVTLIQLIYIVILIPKIIKLWKKNRTRGAILAKMTSLNNELSSLVFEDAESLERLQEIETRIQQIDIEFEALSEEFDNVS